MKRILYFTWDTLRVTNAVNGVPLTTLHYGHDPLNRIVTRNADTFGYNQRSEVVNASIGANMAIYAYDEIGNQTGNIVNSLQTAYTANNLNQYLRVLASSRGTFPAYDSDGNLLSLGDWSYAWDAENRMVAAVSNDITITAYEYDYLGRCVAETTDNATLRSSR